MKISLFTLVSGWFNLFLLLVSVLCWILWFAPETVADNICGHHGSHGNAQAANLE